MKVETTYRGGGGAQTVEMKLERAVHFYPAWDKRDPDDPSKNYGICGVEMHFRLSGPHGCVQFNTLTNWYLPGAHHSFKPVRGYNGVVASIGTEGICPSDLGRHSHTPLREGEELFSEDCHILKGRCYYDGSSLDAVDMFGVLVREGSEGVWKAMESFYRSAYARYLY